MKISKINKGLVGTWSLKLFTDQVPAQRTVNMELIFNPPICHDCLSIVKNMESFDHLIENKERLGDTILLEKDKTKLTLKIKVKSNKRVIKVENLCYNKNDYNKLIEGKTKAEKYVITGGVDLNAICKTRPTPALIFDKCIIS